MGSVLSLVVVLLVDHVYGQFKVAGNTGDKELLDSARRKLGWVERLNRLKLVVFMLFWLFVGTHAILYFNNHRCWFPVPHNLNDWAHDFYGALAFRPTSVRIAVPERAFACSATRQMCYSPRHAIT